MRFWALSSGVALRHKDPEQEEDLLPCWGCHRCRLLLPFGLEQASGGRASVRREGQVSCCLTGSTECKHYLDMGGGPLTPLQGCSLTEREMGPCVENVLGSCSHKTH